MIFQNILTSLNTYVWIIFCSLTIGNSHAQSIEITSFSENPLEVDPLLGATLQVNFKYSIKNNTNDNTIYVALEILNSQNSYVKTISEVTLNSQVSGLNNQQTATLFISSYHQLSENLTTGYYYQVKAILYKSGTWSPVAIANYSNTPPIILRDTSGFTFSKNILAKGADVSWMTEMEANGYSWKDNSGTTKELLPLLKEYQLNAIRLRVWVNPEVTDANGWCDIEDVLIKAKLAQVNNMDILLSIHYSDYWADPGKQHKPTAWKDKSVDELEDAIRKHTSDILNALGNEGIIPKWVQIGNETNNGFLWETGKASTNGFENYARFINAGSSAVKSFNATIKTVVHLANADDNELYKWNIGGLIDNGANFDVIAMSLYPDEDNWQIKVENSYANMLDMKTRFNKEVMIAEVGFSSDKPAKAFQFLTYIIEKTKQAKGLGVFYWEPIAHNNWASYGKGAWDSDGSPSLAMDAFKNDGSLKIITDGLEKKLKVFPNPSSNTLKISLKDTPIRQLYIYDMSGKVLLNRKSNKHVDSLDISMLKKGIYLLKVNNLSMIKFIKK